MNSLEKYEHWLGAACYDLESAKIMLDGGRYLYVAFMSQQSIEKLTKGIYTLYTGKEAPLIHNIWVILKRLTNDSDIKDCIDYQEFDEKINSLKNFFAELLAFYISGRYPSYKDEISKTIDYKRAKRIFEKTREVFKWIESLSQYKKQ